MESFNFWLP